MYSLYPWLASRLCNEIRRHYALILEVLISMSTNCYESLEKILFFQSIKFFEDLQIC